MDFVSGHFVAKTIKERQKCTMQAGNFKAISFSKSAKKLCSHTYIPKLGRIFVLRISPNNSKRLCSRNAINPNICMVYKQDFDVFVNRPTSFSPLLKQRKKWQCRIIYLLVLFVRFRLVNGYEIMSFTFVLIFVWLLNARVPSPRGCWGLWIERTSTLSSFGFLDRMKTPPATNNVGPRGGGFWDNNNEHILPAAGKKTLEYFNTLAGDLISFSLSVAKCSFPLYTAQNNRKMY